MKTEKIYHIYNRCNGNEKMFIEEKNYDFFLKKLNLYALPVADILTYCFMPNHFHLMVRIKTETEIREAFPKVKKLEHLISKQFSNLFSCYTQSFNKTYKRKGSLFMKNFKRKEVESDKYFFKLVYYIHANPVNHGYTTNIMHWRWCSYGIYLNGRRSFINKELLMQKFGSLEQFISFHENKYAILDINEEPHFGKVFNFGKV